MYLFYVYNDYGSSESSVKQLRATLVELFPPPCNRVEFITGQEIQEGRLELNDDDEEEEEKEKKTIKIENRVLCIGGGFDLGYIKTIGKKGCQLIRSFVSQGF